MLYIADWFRDALIPFLIVSGILLVALLGLLVLLRVAETVRASRRDRIASRYQPLVDALLRPESDRTAAESLRATPPRSRQLVGELLLAPLRVSTGSVVDRVGEVAAALGLTNRWIDELDDRRWWVQARAASALGLLQERVAVDRIARLLSDDHEEVRAAATEALGRIGDPSVISALVDCLPDQSRHQHSRVVDALRAFGRAATPVLLEHARRCPRDIPVVADLIGRIRDPEATDDLLRWCSDGEAQVRSSAMRALGSVGLDDRSFYYGLKGLADEESEVRAMAARALGRSRRGEAGPYLAEHLGDDWIVAAHCAQGLQRLGPDGMRELSDRASDTGQAGALAREILWERESVGAGH